MRNKLIVLAVMAAISVPALAMKPMTTEQLARTLGAGRTEKRSDDAVARQLADARLTARLTGVALQQLVAVSPGPKTTQALHAIADASSFLDPPPGELPATPAPDFATQKVIIGRTVDYVAHTLPAMPNFLATRVTQHYVDTTRGLGSEIPEPQGGLFLIGTNRSPISFRDGRETDDPTLATSLASSEKKNHVKNAKDNIPSDPRGGLTSWGEFGPILGVVLLDAAKGKLSWARWEKDEGKPVAVFQFAVDRSISHYSLNYCCDTYETDAFGAPASNGPSTVWKPGYHGRIEVDPEAGTILRISIEAELLRADPIQRAAMMVEYGPVKIGDSI